MTSPNTEQNAQAGTPSSRAGLSTMLNEPATVSQQLVALALVVEIAAMRDELAQLGRISPERHRRARFYCETLGVELEPIS